MGAIDGQEPDAASRRHVLAALGVAAAAPVALGADALAQVQGEGRNNKKKRRNKRKKDKKGDIAILNYALTLEHLEYAFSRDGLPTYGAGDFPAGVYDRLKEILDHEKAHGDALTQTIQGMGGTPVAETRYVFGSTTSAQFLEAAQVLENIGVSAYDGAIAGIKDGDLQTVGATIATVEARHASYVNNVNGDDPFPDAFDTLLTQEEVLAAAGDFIVACS